MMAAMANHWAEHDADVTLVTLDNVETDRFPLDARVRRVGLGLMNESRYPWQAVWNNVARVRRLRQAIRDSGAEQVVSFTDNMNVITLLASVGQTWKVIIAERNDPRQQKMGRGWEMLRRLTYSRCTAMVVQTESVAKYAPRLVRKKPVYVIPNAVTPSAELPDAGRLPAGDRRVVAAMGRLTAQKGFDLLIEAFARIADRHPNWTLRIAGDGEERGNLECLAESLGLTQRVDLCGWIDEPLAFLQEADLFVLSSRYEGFPNALLEAMACGLPVISTDCDSGPREIVRHETDGLLVPAEDVDELTRAMGRLMTNRADRERLGESAVDVVTRFGFGAFFARWEDVLNQTTRTCK